jgi:hypothetical protein
MSIRRRENERKTTNSTKNVPERTQQTVKRKEKKEKKNILSMFRHVS